MDPKVRELLNRLKESAVVYGKAAGKFAGSVMEQAKLNLQIFDLNTEIDIAYKEIGKLVYAMHAGEDVCNEAVQGQLEAIDSKTAQVNEIRARLNQLKKDDGFYCDGDDCEDEECCDDGGCCCCGGEAEETPVKENTVAPEAEADTTAEQCCSCGKQGPDSEDM